MIRPRYESYELAAAQSFALGKRIKLVKLVLACRDREQRRYRCYFTDFNGNVSQVALTRSQLRDCRRTVAQVRTKRGSCCQHWTKLLERQDVERYWKNEVAIAIRRGAIVKREIKELKKEEYRCQDKKQPATRNAAGNERKPAA